MTAAFYPIGHPGQAWADAERAQWLAQQSKLRSFADEVEQPTLALASKFEVHAYGEIQYGAEQYRLRALKSKTWRSDRPTVLVTGGVHGYESSGVHGALLFAAEFAARFDDRINLIIVPCVSPWAYERINRWNALAQDPNRSFRDGGQTAESAALLRFLAADAQKIDLHVDLHETTDSDESEFRPALAARDGKAFEPGEIPDGFYLVGDTENPQLEFHSAVLAEVAKVTHIAPADAKGEIIGSEVVAPGVILYPLKALGLCGGLTNAKFSTTTEVYPDSPRATAAQCNLAQATAVVAAIEFLLKKKAS